MVSFPHQKACSGTEADSQDGTPNLREEHDAWRNLDCANMSARR